MLHCKLLVLLGLCERDGRYHLVHSQFKIVSMTKEANHKYKHYCDDIHTVPGCGNLRGCEVKESLSQERPVLF